MVVSIGTAARGLGRCARGGRSGLGRARCGRARVDARGLGLRASGVRGLGLRASGVRELDVRGVDVRSLDVRGFDVRSLDVRRFAGAPFDERDVDAALSSGRGTPRRGAGLRSALPAVGLRIGVRGVTGLRGPRVLVRGRGSPDAASRSAAISRLSSGRIFPTRRSPNRSGPNWVRVRVSTGFPTASSMRRTTCLRPSCTTISTSALPMFCWITRNDSALTGPSSRSKPSLSRRPASRATGVFTWAT